MVGGLLLSWLMLGGFFCDFCNRFVLCIVVEFRTKGVLSWDKWCFIGVVIWSKQCGFWSLLSWSAVARCFVGCFFKAIIGVLCLHLRDCCTLFPS